MKHHHIEVNIHARVNNQAPRDVLVSLLEEEGDILGWEEGILIYEAAIRIEGSQEAAMRMARFALKGLLRDGVVLRESNLICLKGQ